MNMMNMTGVIFIVPMAVLKLTVGRRPRGSLPMVTTVLFASRAQLTGYDNAGQGELYLYEALSDRLVCVSCNPGGVPATSEAYLASEIRTKSQT